ncbi:excalibur calcium-binding domain-containing protein [Streptomyces sp. NPDC056543]|uniref:excalibur calcium-binding domain-containing protein n=1 Tax=unclassified Streptomyces TaxID=2593676 RepID=UPI00367921E9
MCPVMHVAMTDAPLGKEPWIWWCRMGEREAQGWWARRSMWAKGGLVAGALLLGLLVLGAVLNAGHEPDEGERPELNPSSTMTETLTQEPTTPSTGTATIPGPARSEVEVPPPPPPPTMRSEPVHEETTTESVYYTNCDAVRAAGAAPLRVGEPGYRAGLDGDGDGVACAGD